MSPPNPSEGERARGNARWVEPGSDSLDGYELLVCVTGGVAAYKAAALASALVQAGVGVSVAMSRAARRFVGETTFRALTGRTVYTSLWKGGDGAADIHHLTLSESSDLLLVAPATANVLAKAAHGLADDLVSTLLLGAACPVMMAPAMNARMWAHPAVQDNVARLRARGVILVGPESGWQACRAVGPGRMTEPEVLLAAVRSQLRTAPPRSRSAPRAP